MTVTRFTEAWVRSLPPGSGQFTDATLPGFMLVSGAQRATWYAQAQVRGGRQTKVRVGHWPEVPQVEARRMAAEALAAMRRGEDPREAERAKRARSTTLDSARESARAAVIPRIVHALSTRDPRQNEGGLAIS